ncbi:uncharacterized protein LOC110931403 [Helianthus annuus]|uniref:uncharacterized protein LOC110931403 n=1 Tax=Helianthus annuus TaxID=4232 RepID=UPI001652B7D9|nr:uncharacterized protein LOC110931403 [Helianthus annuus]
MVEDSLLAKIWGDKGFSSEFVGASGQSGGLICVWDPSIFMADDVVKDKNFLLIKGVLNGCGSWLSIFNVYAPQGISAKKGLWDLLEGVVDGLSGLFLLAGDFNAVRYPEERKNTMFKPRCASNFNSFIFNTGLLEYKMFDRQFTRWVDCGKKMNSNFGPKPFRVFNSWLGRDGFEEVVCSAANDFCGSGPPDIVLCNKLRFVRNMIKLWRDEMKEKEEGDISMAKSDLYDLELIMEERDLEEEEVWAMSEAKNMIEEFEINLSKDMKQRSRDRWLRDGDENSKYFHSLVNRRKANNGIFGLSIDGVWCEKPSLIKKDKFKESAVLRPTIGMENCMCLSAEDGAFLTKKFSCEEIKKAVFECGSDRAPGPDGFNFRFFKHFWRLFETDFVNILEDFYLTGKINRGCAASFIALIPKKKDPVGLGDYRSISLVGVVNKVISKILANRMKLVLGSVISESQSAFLKDKFILDGPLVVSEIHTWLKKSKKKAFILKIDFEKAYDNVNWNFVVGVLEQLGFPSRWCAWVRGILSSARASVLVNGSPTFDFPCFKGMRQGDPLSLFLFLVVMEALSYFIDKAVGRGVFKGISLTNGGPCVSHLFYADDAIIMGEWCVENILNVIRVLRCFHICSGLRMNVNKSNIYGIGVDQQEVELVANSFGCNANNLPFKYLGITVGANVNRICNWRPVFEVFESRLSLWKASVLSLGGRVTLVKAVLESLPNYFFSLYKAPVRVVKDLEKLIRRFLWGGNNDGAKLHWVAWDRIASPAWAGGIGLCSLGIVNKALLAKWGWRYKNESKSFWVKVINALHRHKFCWEFLPFKSSLNGVWRNIVKVCSNQVGDNHSLSCFMCGDLGNGRELMFWLDPWLLPTPLKDELPSLFRLEANKFCKVKDRMVRPVSNPNGKWEWRSVPNSSSELAEWSKLYALLQSVDLVDRADRWLWSGVGSIGFSVGAVKRLFFINLDFSSRFVWDWCKWLPKKCNLFAWRAELDRIPTREALKKRGVQIEDDSCPLCNLEVESVDHLFTSCGVTSVIWQKVQAWCKSSNLFVFSFRDILEVHKWVGLDGHRKEVFHGISILTCWMIWRARNDLIFSGKPFRIEKMVKMDNVSKTVKNWPKLINVKEYVDWKDKFEVVVKSEDARMWTCMIDGYVAPTRCIEGRVKVISYEMMDESEKLMVDAEKRALAVIKKSLPEGIKHAFKINGTSREVWEALEKRYQSSSRQSLGGRALDEEADVVKEEKKDTKVSKSLNGVNELTTEVTVTSEPVIDLAHETVKDKTNEFSDKCRELVVAQDQIVELKGKLDKFGKSSLVRTQIQASLKKSTDKKGLGELVVAQDQIVELKGKLDKFGKSSLVRTQIQASLKKSTDKKGLGFVGA